MNSPDLILSLLKEIQLEVATVKQRIVALELSDQRMSRIESYLFGSKMPTPSAVPADSTLLLPIPSSSADNMVMDPPVPVISQGWDDPSRSSSIFPVSLSSSWDSLSPTAPPFVPKSVATAPDTSASPLPVPVKRSSEVSALHSA